MHLIGRLLQLVGLVVPPLAMLLQIMEQIRVGHMLLALVFGASAFFLGRLIEGHVRG